MRVRIVAALVIVSTIASLTVAAASDVDQQASALTHRLMSPYCPGLLLADCRSEGARELRAEILQRLRDGDASGIIEQELIARFGPAIRTEPEFSGLGLVAWFGPLVLGILGLAILARAVRRAMSGSRLGEGVKEVESWRDAEFEERLDDELRSLD